MVLRLEKKNGYSEYDPILHLADTTYSRRFVLKEGSHSPNTGFTECNLLVTAASHEDCQDELRDSLIRPLTSVKSSLKGEILRVRAALAAESACSLQRIPT